MIGEIYFTKNCFWIAFGLLIVFKGGAEAERETGEYMKHISGLDSLRFIAALIVFLGHLNIQLPYSGPVTRALSILWANMSNGPAAVILFFVISGLFIHLPYAGTARRVDLAEFYARRFIRIVIPAGIVLAL